MWYELISHQSQLPYCQGKMGTRFYYKQKKGICDPIIEKLAARFGTNRSFNKNYQITYL